MPNPTFVIAALTALISFAQLTAEEKPLNPRQVTDKYLAAVQAGKADEATALTVPGSTEGSKKRLAEYKDLFGANPIKLSRVYAGKKEQALAISDAIKVKQAKPNEPDSGYLLIKLTRSGDKWLVKDVDLKSAEAVKKAIESFKDKNGDAEEVP